ncbi:MAG TPA: hypothetical protein VKZ18_21350 [Polyangia bacterium]|nr:hypothetical protein [Polyangia bacterium]
MKAFLVLLVFSAAGLVGVHYWRQYMEAHRAPVAAAGPPAREGKERHRRKRRGARRLARNEVFVASAPASEAQPGETAPGEGPPPGVYNPPSDESAPLAPGGAATTEAAPSDVLGTLTQPHAPAPAGGARPAVAEPPAIKLRPADLKMVWQGEDLSRTETMHLDLSNEGGHDLTEDEIDTRFRTKEDAVLGCVARSRPDDSTFIPGRVTVKFRILKTGAVKGVQVEAPVILQRGGLTGCIRGVVSNLRFPASNGGQVISFPFSLM